MRYKIIVLNIVLPLLITGIGVAEDNVYKIAIPNKETYSWVIPKIDYKTWSKMDYNSKYYFVCGYIMGVGTCYIIGEDEIKEYFNEIEGMSFSQIVDIIDNFYRDYPQVRDKYDLERLIHGILIRLRKGQDPLTE